MKKLHVYIEKENGIKELEPSFAQLKEMGADVCIHTTFFMPKEDIGDCLILTDVPGLACELAKEGYPVLAYVHEGNRQDSLPYVKYVVEGFEDADGGFFWRVWQRLTGKPWYITETERCLIRETTESDVDAFYGIYREPSITAYMENLFPDREEEKQYVKDYREKIYEFYNFGMWTVLDKASGVVIGRAGVSMREGYEDPELGFVIAKPFQGRGIATEVCQRVLAFMQEEFGFTRFQALVHKENAASLRVLSKLGFFRACSVREGGRELELYLCDMKKSDVLL